MDKMVIHRNLSLATRGNLVINRINKGATSEELEQEFKRKVETLLRTVRTHHYTGPRGEKLYEQLRQQLKENNQRAATTVQNQNPDDTFPGVDKPTEEKMIPMPQNPTEEKVYDTVYLVETSTVLNCDMEELLQMDEGTAVFYIPRFCINDLRLMCHDDKRAESAFKKIYSDGIFEERIFPVNNVSPENSIFTEATKDFKRRTISIVDAAVELAMSFHSADKIRVKILTASREVIDLARKVIEDEGLNDILSFALLARKR